MIEVISNLDLSQIFGAILSVIGAAAAVAALTPTPKDDRFISKTLKVVRKIANVLGLNVGHAKNRED